MAYKTFIRSCFTTCNVLIHLQVNDKVLCSYAQTKAGWMFGSFLIMMGKIRILGFNFWDMELLKNKRSN